MSGDLFIPLGASRDLIDEKYLSWKRDSSSVDSQWGAFFQGFEIASENSEGSALVEKFLRLVDAYRALGHQKASLNPLSSSSQKNEEIEDLKMETYGLEEKHLSLPISHPDFFNGEEVLLAEAIKYLESVYCGKVGVEFFHIENSEIRSWLIQKLERNSFPQISVDFEKKMLQWILEAQLFEEFLGKKFIGEKRFSIEGAEATLVFLKILEELSFSSSVKGIFLGMAHRGRLNVLTNFLRKPCENIFKEFVGVIPSSSRGVNGDVKYHMGYENLVYDSQNRELKLSLAPNPSHLEAVNSVVEGKVRALQDSFKGENQKNARNSFIPVLIHGDAAMAGQGVVFEGLNASSLDACNTGGTIHFVINNQIGFTTHSRDARSSRYCSDVAKSLGVLVFHVNGESLEDILQITSLAFEYRQKFGKSVVIDMYCYRRHGHNETDQPAFTQPMLTDIIAKHLPLGDAFSQTLIQKGVLTEEEYIVLKNQILSKYEEQFSSSQNSSSNQKHSLSNKNSWKIPVPTGVKDSSFQEVARHLVKVPSDFCLHPTLEKRFFSRRKKALEDGDGFDWAFAESLAWGTLLQEGFSVRLSGQDSRRGTFSHRHSVLYDSENRNRYIPLNNLTKGNARFSIYNSLLSESAVLGFEYGYSLVHPEALVMWEAQFGDFVNGAQIMIDQFITSSEVKWGEYSDLVLLLPHGYEGQGPEHSSARLERFLQSCAQENIQVANLTIPAQYFHILRRQKKRKVRMPLILMTPKSLLSHPLAISSKKDFLNNRGFQEVLPDFFIQDSNRVSRLIFCTGKVFFDLHSYREENQISDVAIIRIEQLYPLHIDILNLVIQQYPNAKTWAWCQEEPQNMGAWSFIAPKIKENFGFDLLYVGRSVSASTASGWKKVHNEEQKKLVFEAFNV